MTLTGIVLEAGSSGGSTCPAGAVGRQRCREPNAVSAAPGSAICFWEALGKAPNGEVE